MLQSWSAEPWQLLEGLMQMTRAKTTRYTLCYAGGAHVGDRTHHQHTLVLISILYNHYLTLVPISTLHCHQPSQASISTFNYHQHTLAPLCTLLCHHHTVSAHTPDSNNAALGAMHTRRTWVSNHTFSYWAHKACLFLWRQRLRWVIQITPCDSQEVAPVKKCQLLAFSYIDYSLPKK